mmetsp:Transcript_19055/g.45785  ORF Transcript_19055/g.45785 Transcript_19055/m.45785 type:complete len:101 (+) Transcript_19055:955-1257(+)
MRQGEGGGASRGYRNAVGGFRGGAEAYEGRLSAMNETAEELELIGMYVDQLEDRLANYALARKEAEASKFECERLALKSEKERRRGRRVQVSGGGAREGT